ncbi:unnamed protein product, partial [Ectocarpus fasciculatus]
MVDDALNFSKAAVAPSTAAVSSVCWRRRISLERIPPSSLSTSTRPTGGDSPFDTVSQLDTEAVSVSSLSSCGELCCTLVLSWEARFSIVSLSTTVLPPVRERPRDTVNSVLLRRWTT